MISVPTGKSVGTYFFTNHKNEQEEVGVYIDGYICTTAVYAILIRLDDGNIMLGKTQNIEITNNE